MATKARKSTAAAGTEAAEEVFQNGSDALKNGFDKAAKGYEQFVLFGKESADAVLKSATMTGKSIETINGEVFAYSRQSMEDSIAAAKAILASKTVQEALEVQSEFTKSAFEKYVAEFSKVRELAMDAAKAASEPLQSRVTALADLVQPEAA